MKNAPVPHLRSKAPGATIASARAQIVALRHRYRGIRLVPSIEQAKCDLETVERVAASVAPVNVASTMIGELLKAWDRQAAEPADQLAIYVAVLYDDDSEEEATVHGEFTWYQERGLQRFSEEVLAFAVMRLWKTHKWKPSATELLEACKQEQRRMNRLAADIRERIKDTENEPARIEREERLKREALERRRPQRDPNQRGDDRG